MCTQQAIHSCQVKLLLNSKQAPALVHVARAVSAVQLAGLAHAGRVTGRRSGAAVQ